MKTASIIKGLFVFSLSVGSIALFAEDFANLESQKIEQHQAYILELAENANMDTDEILAQAEAQKNKWLDDGVMGFLCRGVNSRTGCEIIASMIAVCTVVGGLLSFTPAAPLGHAMLASAGVLSIASLPNVILGEDLFSKPNALTNFICQDSDFDTCSTFIQVALSAIAVGVVLSFIPPVAPAGWAILAVTGMLTIPPLAANALPPDLIERACSHPGVCSSSPNERPKGILQLFREE